MKIEKQIQLTTRKNQIGNLVDYRLQKIEVLAPNATRAEVHVRENVGKEPNNTSVNIELHLPNFVLFAEGFAEKPEKALTVAVDKLKQQLIKTKEKQAGR